MDIKLTPYGRYLLSIGKFKPKFYEFVDDDIIYDISSSNSVEAQEDSHDRIMNQTPKLKTLYLKRGIQTDSEFDYGQTGSVNLNINEIRGELQEISPNQKGIYALGRSSYSSDKTPAFQVTMLQGEISSSVNFLSSSKGQVLDSLQIPQIEYEFLVSKTTESQLVNPSEKYAFTSTVAKDGTYNKLEFETPIIHLKEFNSFYEKENFEIEVFMVKSGSYNNGESKEILFPLKFVKQQQAIVNDLLVLEGDYNDLFPGLIADQEGVELPQDQVEYYFNIQVDDEIPAEELCEVINKLEINNQFLDEELICPEERTERFDIYSSRVRPGDLEDCD